MKRKLVVLLTVVVVLAVVIAAPVSAKKPAPKLLGEMTLSQSFLVPPAPCSPGIYTWRGTVTIDSIEYGMAFIKLGTGKAFDDNPSDSVSFFEEVWAIYAPDFTLPTTSCPSTDDALIWGNDSGVSNRRNNTYRMNGDVVNAIGDFDGWEGGKVHMSGTFNLDFPMIYAPGTFRLN